jgi:hypothetical protein
MTTAPDRLAIDLAVPGLLAVHRPPEDVLAEAHHAAAILKGVLDAKPKKVVINDETYLEFEDWQTVGRFYGIAPKVLGSRYVEFGSVAGWEATAEAVHVETGRVVSAAEAMCLNDEPKWGRRASYEWHYLTRSGGTSLEDPGREELIWEKGPTGRPRPKKERVRVADEAVPMFQLRSMAQTRAAAKALRNALAWVVVLAGYRPTPAEETDDPREPVAPTPSRPEPEETSDAPDVPAPDPEPSDDRRALWRKIRQTAKTRGISSDERRALWSRYCGTASPETADPAALADLLAALEAM